MLAVGCTGAEREQLHRSHYGVSRSLEMKKLRLPAISATMRASIARALGSGRLRQRQSREAIHTGTAENLRNLTVGSCFQQLCGGQTLNEIRVAEDPPYDSLFVNDHLRRCVRVEPFRASATVQHIHRAGKSLLVIGDDCEVGVVSLGELRYFGRVVRNDNKANIM